MKLLDLTHTITEDMPVYPGDPGPRLTPAATVPRDGYRETLLTFCSHTGTHMDAPAHLFGDLSTLDAQDVERFAGPAAAVDCTRLPAGAEIGPECLDGLDLERLDFVLFSTGWCRYWGKPEYFAGFPVFSPACAGRLAAAGSRAWGWTRFRWTPWTRPICPTTGPCWGPGWSLWKTWWTLWIF